ncbi:Beta-apo-4'-carotenal oxygenase [Podosphaera aphanis]|nr:Beta-apo-4'-carotenal oxygenase [Podosphaera aphanis]
MTTTKQASFEATPIDSISGIVNTCKASFRSQKTKSIEYRIHQLRKLYWGINDYSDAIVEACKQDLGKPAFETYVTEIDWCKNDILYVTEKLKKWMEDESVPDISLLNSVLNPTIRKEPLGTVLVIGAYNFPFQLSVCPFVGAIAAGCTGVLKPSEMSPASARVLETIFKEYLDPTSYVVVNGGIPETNALLNEKWNKIFYTGSSQVGTIIAQKAAESLTPVCLELGGRNPAIVTKNTDARLAARRLLWGKIMNAGQLCVSQNYILVERDILPAFVEQMKCALHDFYPNGQKSSPDFARIVNKRHFLRIKKMLDDTRGKILIGGGTDEADKFIEITVVKVEDINDSMIVEESFGPLIPIMAFDGVEEAVSIANSVHSTPLALYTFGTKAETDKVLDRVTSGGATVNDAFFHSSVPTLPFGGVGDSGQGAYRGKSSFDIFTHRRSIVTTPNWMEKILTLRYPPYDGKLQNLRRIGLLKPNFDRNCKEIKGFRYWTGLFLRLGGKSSRSIFSKWVFVLLIALVARKWRLYT